MSDPAYSSRTNTSTGLQEPLSAGKMIFGIQGGKGSFNEEAVQTYIQKNKIEDFEIRYLYTSQNVVDALCRGDINRGQCAIYNSTGGYVAETAIALENSPCYILEEFSIKISHTLMIRPDATMDEMTTIMCHPQVFAQCRQNLDKKYPHLKRVSGEGDLLDTAKVAEALAHNELPRNVAVLGSKVLASLYRLTIIEDNLQDLADNFTRFLQVELRP